MKKPATMEEYLYLVDETTFEIGDLIASEAEDEAGDEAEQDLDRHFAHPLEEQLKELQETITAGNYAFENTDLPFMATVNEFRKRIPFVAMLDMINRTHREGLGG
jgi:hypothetical protein